MVCNSIIDYRSNSSLGDSRDDEILVTVLCITYNHAAYIKYALEGFLAQRANFKFEVIVYDDHSTDNTRDTLLEYKAKYPEFFNLILSGVNQYSINGFDYICELIDAARGKYVALCEGDDYWNDANKLSAQVEALEQNNHLDMCFHPAFSTNPYTKSVDLLSFLGDKSKVVSCGDVIEGGGGFIPTASLLFKKSVNAKVNALMVMDNNIRVKDYLFQIMGSIPLGAIYLPKPMSYYRRIQDSNWSSNLKSPQFLREHTSRNLDFVMRMNRCLDGRFEKNFQISFERELIGILKGVFIDDKDYYWGEYNKHLGWRFKMSYFFIYRHTSLLRFFWKIKNRAAS